MKAKSPEIVPRIIGERQRKVMPRTDLAHWDPAARKQQPLDLLEASTRNRIQALVTLKNERMAASAFGFFRGAVPVMAYDLSLSPHTAIVTQLCGDAHLQNLGAYCGLNGRLVFDINDFDETIRGPFEWDVKRMATSVLVAGGAAKIAPGTAAAAATTFLDAYCAMMRKFAGMTNLAVSRYQVHRLQGVAPISKILRKAEHETPVRSFERLTEQTPKGRVFRSVPPLLRPVNGAEMKAVLDSLPAYAESMLPEHRHFFARFQPIAVGFKVVGTGSLGLFDYCVLLHGNGVTDPLFLQIKEEAPSAYAPYLHQATPKNDGQRAAEGQRAMQFQSDPLLGWTRIDGRSFLVRQLNDHKAAVDATAFNASGLDDYAMVCGEMLARGHARSGDSRVIAGYVGNGARFKRGILGFARAYAAQTVADWKLLVAHRKQHPANRSAVK